MDKRALAPLTEGPIIADVQALLSDLPELLAARAVSKRWCDSAHWFVIAAAAERLESNDTTFTKEALLGLLRLVDRRPPGLWLWPASRAGIWRPLKRAWQVPVPWAGRATLVWTPQFAAERTPSRLAGVSLAQERNERSAACKCVHLFARRFCRKGEPRERIRSLACYFVQLLFMYIAVQPDALHIAAAAAVSLARLSTDVAAPSAEQLKEELEVIDGKNRAESGRETLAPHELSILHEQAFEFKLILLRILRFDLMVELPHVHVESLVSRMLTYLPGGAALIANEFTLRSREMNPAIQPEGEEGMDSAAVIKVLGMLAKRFLDDMMLSMSPLLAEPTAVAAASVLVAMQAIDTNHTAARIYQSRIHKSLQSADHWLRFSDMGDALQEWSELRKSQGKLVAPWWHSSV